MADSADSADLERDGYVGETYLKVRGCWCYPYRAIYQNGNLIDVILSEHRYMKAAKIKA